jgi:hypothetical protein
MALNPRLSVASRNLALNAALDPLNGGSLRLYDGAQPTDADTAHSNTLLVTLPLSATAFAPASSGSKTANTITSASAVASATATWYSLIKSDTTTRVADGSVGTSGANLNLNAVAIVSGATVSVTSMIYSMSA